MSARISSCAFSKLSTRADNFTNAATPPLIRVNTVSAKPMIVKMVASSNPYPNKKRRSVKLVPEWRFASKLSCSCATRLNGDVTVSLQCFTRNFRGEYDGKVEVEQFKKP